MGATLCVEREQRRVDRAGRDGNALRGEHVFGELSCARRHRAIGDIVEGLRYAFPKRMKRFERKVPRLLALHDRVARRPRIAAYLASDRRIAFSQWGIYRYFKDLDS